MPPHRETQEQRREREKTERLRAARLARDAARHGPVESDYPVYGMRDELLFGKHQGEAVEDVLESDPGWLLWALGSVRGFSVADEVQLELDCLDDPRRPANRRR